MNRTSRFKTARGWHWLLASQCRAARFDDSKHRLASSEWHPCALVAIALALWSLGRHIPQAAGAEPSGEVSAEQELLTKSLPLRTALHHDPTLAAPLDRLVTLYRSAGRVDELLGMYRAHVAHYPADPGGRTVLIRLLVATGDPAASDSARAAAAQFPQNAFLQHVLYEILQQRRDPRALDHLDRAIQALGNVAEQFNSRHSQTRAISTVGHRHQVDFVVPGKLAVLLFDPLETLCACDTRVVLDALAVKDSDVRHNNLLFSIFSQW